MNRSRKRSSALKLARNALQAYRAAHAEFQTCKDRLEETLDRLQAEADRLQLYGFASSLSSQIDNPEEWDDFHEIIDSLKDDLLNELDDDLDGNFDAEISLDDALQDLLYEDCNEEELKEGLRRASARLERSEARLRRLRKLPRQRAADPRESADNFRDADSDFDLDGEAPDPEEDSLSLRRDSGDGLAPPRRRVLEAEAVVLIAAAGETCKGVSVALHAILTELRSTLEEYQSQVSHLLPIALRPNLLDNVEHPSMWEDAEELRGEWMGDLLSSIDLYQGLIKLDEVDDIIDRAAAAYRKAYDQLMPLQGRFDSLMQRADATELTMVSLCLEEWRHSPEQWKDFLNLPNELRQAFDDDMDA